MSWRTSAQQAEWIASGGQHGRGQRVPQPASNAHSGYSGYAGGHSQGTTSLQGGFGGAGFAVGGDLQSTNERLQKQINDKQTMIDQMLQADSVRSRKMDEERRELIGLRSQAADSGGREARLKAEHAAAIENYTFEAKQLRTQLTAKDARVESMRQAHGDATQQLNTRMVELERLQTGAAHHAAEKETSARTLRDTQSALMQAKAEAARNVGIVQELQNRLTAQLNSVPGRALQDLKSRLFKQSQTLEGFEEDNIKLKQAAVQHEGAVLAFRAKSDRADSVHADLKQEVDQLTTQLAEVRDNLTQTLSSMSEAGSQSEKITAAWTREMEMQAEALKAREGTLTLEKERNKMLEERILELRGTDSAEVERLKMIISENKDERIIAKAQLAAAEVQRKTDAKEAEALASTLRNEAEALASTLRNDVADAEGKAAAVKKMARVQMLTNKRYKEKIDALMQEAEAHVSTISRLKSKLGANASREEESRLTRIASWKKLIESNKIINSHRKEATTNAPSPSSSVQLDNEISRLIILQSQQIEALLNIQVDFDATKGRIETLEHDVKQAELLGYNLKQEATDSKLQASKIAEDAQSSIDEISKEAHSTILQNESESKTALESFEARLEESQSSIRTVSGLFASEAAKAARMEATIATMEEEWRAVEQNHAEAIAKAAEELVLCQENEGRAINDLNEAQLQLQNLLASNDPAQETIVDLHQRSHAQEERIVDLETALATALHEGSTAENSSDDRFTEQLQLAFSRIQELEGELLHVRQTNVATEETHNSALVHAAAAAEASNGGAGTKGQLRRATETIQNLEYSLAESRAENASIASEAQTSATSANHLQRAIERIQELEIALSHSKQAAASLTAISDASGTGSQGQLRVAVTRIQELEVNLLQVKQASAQINARSSAAETNKSERLLVQEDSLMNASDRILKLEAALANAIGATKAQKRIAAEAMMTVSEAAANASQLEHALSQSRLEKAALAEAAAANNRTYSSESPMTNPERAALQENIVFLKEAVERAQKQTETVTEDLASARDAMEKGAALTADAQADALKVQATLNDSVARQSEDSECHAATVAALKMRITGLEAKLAETASSTPDFERMLGELTKANTDLRSADDKAKEAEERASTHQRQCAVVQSQLNITSNACIQLSMEHDTLKTDYTNLDAKFKTSEEKLDVAVAARTELETKMLTFATRLESQATSESQSKREQEREVAKEMGELLTSRDEGLKRIASITTLNKEAAQRIAALEKEMYNASLNHIAVTTQLEAKNKDLSEKTIYQGKTERHCVEEFAGALAEIKVLTDLRKVMEKDLAGKTETIDDLEESVNLLTEELDETRKQLLDVTKQAQTLKGQFAESASGTWQEGQLNTQRLHSAQMEVQRLLHKISELKGLYSDLEVSTEAQAAAHAEQCRQFAERLADEQELQAALVLEKDAAFDDKCDELAQVNAEVPDQLDEVEATCAAEKQALTQKWECDMAEARTAHENALSDLIYRHEDDVEVLQQANIDAASKHQSETTHVKQTHASAMEALAEDNAALARRHNAKLEKLKESHQTVVQNLKDEHSDTLNKLYDSNEQAIDSLTSAHDTIAETLEAELDASEDHVADVSRRALRKHALLEADVSRLSEENGTLFAKLKVKTAEFEDLQDLLNTCRDTVAEKEAVVTELEHQIADLAGERLGVQTDNAERTATLEESMRSINMMVLQKTSQLAQMETRILSLTGEKDNLNLKLTQATIHNLRDEQINQYNDMTQAELEAQITRLEGHAECVAKERDALSQQLVVALEQPIIANARHKERVAEFQDTIRTLTADNVELNSGMASLQQSLESVQDDLQAATTNDAKQFVQQDKAIATLSENSVKVAADHAHWKKETAAKLALVEAAKAAAEKDVADKTELVDRIEARLKSTEANRNELLEQLSQSTATTLRMSQMKMHILDEKEGIALNLAAANETEKTRLALSEYKDEGLKRLADEIATLKKELAASQMTNASSLGSIAKLKEQALCASGEMETKNSILERVEARYVVLERERDELLGKISSFTAKSMRVAQLQRLMLDGTEEYAADDTVPYMDAGALSPVLSSTATQQQLKSPGSPPLNESAPLDSSAIVNTNEITAPANPYTVNPFLEEPINARGHIASKKDCGHKEPPSDHEQLHSSTINAGSGGPPSDCVASSSSLMSFQEELNVSAISTAMLNDSGLNTSAASPTSSRPQKQRPHYDTTTNQIELITDLDAPSFASSQKLDHLDAKLDDSGLNASSSADVSPSLPRQQSLYESMMHERSFEQTTDLDVCSVNGGKGFDAFKTHRMASSDAQNPLATPTINST